MDCRPNNRAGALHSYKKREDFGRTAIGLDVKHRNELSDYQRCELQRDLVSKSGNEECSLSYESCLAAKSIEIELRKFDYLIRTLGPKRLSNRKSRAMAELDLVATTPISPSGVHILFSDDPEFSNVYWVVKRNLIAPLLLDINQAGGVVRDISFEYNGTKLFADRLSLEAVMRLTKRQILARQAPWLVAGLVVLVAMGTYIYAQAKLSTAAEELDATISGLEVQARQARNFLAARQAEIDYVTSLRHDRTDLPSSIRLWDEVTGTIPDNTWLTDLSFKTGKVQLTGFSTSASALLKPLEASSLFANAEFSGTVVKVPGRDGNQFTIRLDVEAK